MNLYVTETKDEVLENFAKIASFISDMKNNDILNQTYLAFIIKSFSKCMVGKKIQRR